jgi:hypothetical protein
MAEPDAAGHPPASGPEPRASKGPRSLTLADVQRDMDRSLAPMRAEVSRLERDRRRVAAVVEAGIGRFIWEIEPDGSIDRWVESEMLREWREMEGHSPPPTSEREISSKPDQPTPPPAVLFPGGDVPAANPPPAPPLVLSPEEIRAALAPMLKELVADIKRTLAEPAKSQTKRGDSTSERLRNLFEEDPEFAICRTLKEIGARIGRTKSSIAGRDCHYYHFKLKPLREKKAAAVSLAADDAARRLPSKKQAGRAMKAHLDWQAAIDDAIDRDGGSHLGTTT